MQPCTRYWRSQDERPYDKRPKMSEYIFKLPDLGEGTVESEIAEWRVQAGDYVEMDAPLVDMMTDKATVEITAPVAGRVSSLAGEAGDVIAVGAALVVFETGEYSKKEAVANPEPELTQAEETAEIRNDQQTRPAAAQVERSQRPLTSPSIRRRAREAGIDLGQIVGSGPKNRISHADLDSFIAAQDGALASVPTEKVTAEKNDAVTNVPITGVRRKIAEKMAQSKQSIPHFGYVEEIDISALEALRQELNEGREAGQVKLSYLPFFLLALKKVLKTFPQCNARYDEAAGVLRQHAGLHVGIATQTEAGLMVPVVRHVEALDLWGCAAAIQRVAAAARTHTATRQDLSGSTITITSLGALGGVAVMPIINHPEVAIIGVNKAEQRAVVRKGQIVTRRMMNLSSCFDHRVIDGYDAARMIQYLKKLLEHPALIFIP